MRAFFVNETCVSDAFHNLSFRPAQGDSAVLSGVNFLCKRVHGTDLSAKNSPRLNALNAVSRWA